MPWRSLLVLSARAVRKMDRVHAPPSVRIPDLLEQMREAAAGLKGPHAEAMHSVMASDHAPDGRPRLSPSLREFYLAQARALMRCARLDENQRDGPLLAAHAAALWAMRYSDLTLGQRCELADWLRASHEHIREILLACIDDVLLLMLRHDYSCTR
jgi:hypothetical protein